MNLSTARVFVKDHAVAHSFYAQALGLPVEAGSPEADFSVFRAGNCQLVVETVPDDAPEEDRVLVGRFTGLSFTVQDVQAQYMALLSKGVQFTGQPELQLWGGTLATFRDPAGNELQLVQYPSAA
jgi:catechol 2,3-dioxygenase-like lactoylglutathione lyase family enzyme